MWGIEGFCMCQVSQGDLPCALCRMMIYLNAASLVASSYYVPGSLAWDRLACAAAIRVWLIRSAREFS